jgi:damage-control phosphatase, subfamily I
MKTHPECLPCFMKQIVLAAQRVTDDPVRVLAAAQAAARHFPALSADRTPPENASRLLHAVAEHLGTGDPYAAEKARYNDLALHAYDALHAYIQAAPDPLAAALRVAAVGNVLDLNIFDQVDVSAAVEQARAMTWAIDHTPPLQRDIARAARILVLGDNAGEIVFDRLLVEALPAGTVTYAVKGGPIANDVTRADAVQVGLDRVADVIDTGAAMLGAPLEQCSRAFRAVFDAADVIIAKGMANLETLDTVDANLYFIAKIKCDVLARAIDVPSGALVVLAQRGR